MSPAMQGVAYMELPGQASHAPTLAMPATCSAVPRGLVSETRREAWLETLADCPREQPFSPRIGKRVVHTLWRAWTAGPTAWGRGLLLIIVIATTYALTHSGQGAKFQRVPSQGEGRADPLELGWVKSNGSPLPRLDAMSTIGTDNPASRSDLLLVNLWASYCAPCTEELPLLAQANDRGNIHVVGVSRDVYLDRAQQAMAVAGVDYPNYSDVKGHFADSLHGVVPPNLLPMTLLVVNNRIEWVHIGPFGSISDIAKASSLVR